jgi:hypothetical protein
MEHHDRALSSRDADKYAEGNEDVVDMAILICSRYGYSHKRICATAQQVDRTTQSP